MSLADAAAVPALQRAPLILLIHMPWFTANPDAPDEQSKRGHHGHVRVSALLDQLKYKCALKALNIRCVRLAASPPRSPLTHAPLPGLTNIQCVRLTASPPRSPLTHAPLPGPHSMVVMVQPGELAGCVPRCGGHCTCVEARHHRAYMQRNIAAHLTGQEDVFYAHADMWINLSMLSSMLDAGAANYTMAPSRGLHGTSYTPVSSKCFAVRYQPHPDTPAVACLCPPFGLFARAVPAPPPTPHRYCGSNY